MMASSRGQSKRRHVGGVRTNPLPPTCVGRTCMAMSASLREGTFEQINEKRPTQRRGRQSALHIKEILLIHLEINSRFENDVHKRFEGRQRHVGDRLVLLRVCCQKIVNFRVLEPLECRCDHRPLKRPW